MVLRNRHYIIYKNTCMFYLPNDGRGRIPSPGHHLTYWLSELSGVCGLTWLCDKNDEAELPSWRETKQLSKKNVINILRFPELWQRLLVRDGMLPWKLVRG
jgi:hypothetical protein